MDEPELVDAGSCHPLVGNHGEASPLALFRPEAGCIVASSIARSEPTLILVAFDLDQQLRNRSRSHGNQEIRRIYTIFAASLFEEADRERLAHDAVDLWRRAADDE